MKRKIEIPIQAIIVKDENSGEEKTVQTVRTVAQIIGYIQETETEALNEKVLTIDYDKID